MYIFNLLILLTILFFALTHALHIDKVNVKLQTLSHFQASTAVKLDHNALPILHEGTMEKNYAAFLLDKRYGPPKAGDEKTYNSADEHIVSIKFNKDVTTDVHFKYTKTKTVVLRIPNKDRPNSIQADDQCFSASAYDDNLGCGGKLSWIHGGKTEKTEGFMNCPHITGSEMVEFFERVTEVFLGNEEKNNNVNWNLLMEPTFIVWV